jgi:hypothetical protein
MFNNFLSFWQLLSKPGVSEKHLFSRLLETEIPHLPKKLSQVVKSFPGIKNRNTMQADLQILADLIVEDISRALELEEEFLLKCYCQSGALSQYALLSKSILSHRYEALFSDNISHPTLAPATTKKGLSDGLIAESFTKRPVLILGDVGVGKTMFFRHFIKVQAKDIFENAILLYIDFGIKAAFAKDVQQFALDEIIIQLRENYSVDIYNRQFVHATYHGDLVRFSKGIYGDLRNNKPELYTEKELEFLESKLKNTEQHLISSLDHVAKGRKKQVVLFLDNADQRTDEIQQQVFIMAQSVAAIWPCAVFLALRPETFQRSKEVGALSAYHLKAFTVSPPRIDEVLIKRLNFGLDITRGKLPASLLPVGVTINLENVSIFLQIVKDSLTSIRDIIECVDNLAGGNVRIALEFIKNLIGSGHIDTQKILARYKSSGSYNIRLHEFLRSVTFIDSVYYDPASSPIVNLYDIHTLDSNEHFLSLTLLSYIQQEGDKVNQHGFVSVETMYEVIQGYGYTPDQIDFSLSRLCRKHLIENAGRIQPLEKSISFTSVRLTSIGAYHLFKLPYMFVYYDSIVTDIPILIPEIQNKILDIVDIRDRLNRANILITYLDGCFKGIASKCTIVDWGRMYSSTKGNIKNIAENPRVNIRS